MQYVQKWPGQTIFVEAKSTHVRLMSREDFDKCVIFFYCSKKKIIICAIIISLNVNIICWESKLTKQKKNKKTTSFISSVLQYVDFGHKTCYSIRGSFLPWLHRPLPKLQWQDSSDSNWVRVVQGTWGSWSKPPTLEGKQNDDGIAEAYQNNATTIYQNVY